MNTREKSTVEYVCNCEGCGEHFPYGIGPYHFRYQDNLHFNLRRQFPGHEPGPGDMRNVPTGDNLLWRVNRKRETRGLSAMDVFPASLCTTCNPRPPTKYHVVAGDDFDGTVYRILCITLTDALSWRKILLEKPERTFFRIERA